MLSAKLSGEPAREWGSR